MAINLKQQSPLNTYLEHCAKGDLAYQVCTDDGDPVFYPRAVAPGTGSTNLEWRVSKGLGTVYTTTVVRQKGEPPLNVAMIDLDEGFRMMSRVEGIDPARVRIGMRVKVIIHPGDEKQPPYPVFTPADGDACAACSEAALPPSAPPTPISGKSRRARVRSI